MSSRQLATLRRAVGSGQPASSSTSRRDSNRSRGKSRGRGGKAESVRPSRDKAEKTAIEVAKALFPQLRRQESVAFWSIGDIDVTRNLAQITCSRQGQHDINIDKLDGTIFNYETRQKVAMHLGYIPEITADQIQIEAGQNAITFEFGDNSVSYPVDVIDGKPQVVFEPGYEGLLCVAYRHKGETLVGSRKHIEIGRGYFGESRRFQDILDQTDIDFASWFTGYPDSTVFYFILVASDLLLGSRQYVPQDMQYVVYLGMRDMENLESPLNSVAPEFVSKSAVPSRVQRCQVHPIRQYDIDDANEFLINGYSGQQRASQTGWLQRRINQNSEPYAKLFPSKIVCLFPITKFPAIALKAYDMLNLESVSGADETFFLSNVVAQDDYNLTHRQLEMLLEDMLHMPDFEEDYPIESEELRLLYKFVRSAQMADTEFLDQQPSVLDVTPKLRNSESVVAYIRHTSKGIPTYSLVHIYSSGMHFRRGILKSNQLLTTYLKVYETVTLSQPQIAEQFYVEPNFDPNYRFDICTLPLGAADIHPTLLAKIILRDCLPEGRQNVDIEAFDQSIVSSITRFIEHKATGIVPAVRNAEKSNFRGDAENQDSWISKLIFDYQYGKKNLVKQINEMSFADMIELYRYINSMYIGYLSTLQQH